MKNLYLAVVLFFAFSIQSCAPVLIGGLFYGSAKSREAKQQFMEEFHRNNTDRESKGLKPLDLCEEKVAFDAKWAFENKECKDRFKDKVKK